MNTNNTFRFRNALVALKECRTSLEALNAGGDAALLAAELEAAAELVANSVAIVEMLAETGGHAVYLADVARDVPEILNLLNASASTPEPNLEEMLSGIDEHLQTSPRDAEYRIGLRLARRGLQHAKTAISGE
ncbi:hypothetical protein [Lysobacter sp. Hz 25]|uniref:hypothetical protein n=1 Tax=Lysobacter sp. Hz 25 TaxID=3383698 RepID=UPI0038D36640